MHLKSTMLEGILVLLLLTTSVLGGSPCPPREKIYPCTCTNVQQGKNRFVTIVMCHRLDNSDSLTAIFPFLRTMEIDQFHLYDSFWSAELLGDAGESQRVLPADWMTLMKIQEIDIVDTTLSSCFACQWELNCRNIVTTRFKMTNSSSTDKICTLCDTSSGNKYPWTACMNKLEEFHFNYGKLTSFGADFFPLPMRELKYLDLSFNQIVKIDPNALKNLPQLTTLDLSHNAIEFFDHIFTSQESQLKYLDVSWNFIKRIGGDMFNFLPNLNTFKAAYNVIGEMKENDWSKAPKNLRVIDLSSNRLHCGCNMRWINGSFSSSVVLQGYCFSPEEYQNTPLRRASRFLIERCDAAGNIGSRKPTSPRPRNRHP